MKYKAVLFDMDGTVLNTLGDLAAAVNHTLREFSMPERSIAEVAAALGISRSYVSRIEKSVLERMSRYLEGKDET